jgi:hypothetical protein
VRRARVLPDAGGRAYALAVGNQVALITCFGQHAPLDTEMDSTCRRIAQTIKPAS